MNLKAYAFRSQIIQSSVIAVLVACITVQLSACATPRTQQPSAEKSKPELHDTYFLTRDGYRLPFLPQTNQPIDPKALVIALHGFNDYSLAFKGMCEHLIKKGIACFAYDQRGFGATTQRGIWPGDGVMESDLVQLTALLEQKYPEHPIYLIGESMGGAVIISAMTSTSLGEATSVAGAALLAPAVWGRETQPWYQRWALELAVRITPGWTPTGESLDIVATDNIEALRAMGRDELVIKETRIDAIYGLTNLMDKALERSADITKPTLILYGEKDEVIPAAPTCLMLEKMEANAEQKTLRFYPHGYHMLTRDLQAQRVFEDLETWIVSRRTQPSTMDPTELCSSQDVL